MARPGDNRPAQGVADATRDALRLVLVVAGAGVALYLTDIGCVVRRVTGLACPGCGMTRAWLAVLRLDFAAAVAYHPLFWAAPLAVALLWAQEVSGRVVRRAGEGGAPRGLPLRLARGFLRCHNVVLLALLGALLALWAVRLLDPVDTGLLFGGTPPAGVSEPDVVNWTCPEWLLWTIVG